MKVILQQSSLRSNQDIKVSGSKSETNRWLLLQKFFPNIHLQNISDSDDSRVMQAALNSTDPIIDVHHAGTAMRFLTAYFAVQPGREVVLTGSDRMKQRPISILVEALMQLGAQIEYLEKDGFPPLKITGKNLQGKRVSLAANISSQYISALLLIAPQMECGLDLSFEGIITSQPYITMTLAVLTELGIENSFNGNRVYVGPKREITSKNIVIESDWSSASYFYAMVALSPVGTVLNLSYYNQFSMQGDSELVNYFCRLGVETQFKDKRLVLVKQTEGENHFEADFIDTPDLAQTVVVTCFGLGISCRLSGLHTLKIKETDRLKALQTELRKFGAKVSITEDCIQLNKTHKMALHGAVDTYQDHRMAMAFAPLALKTGLTINEGEVVTKSFIHFWENLQSLGFQLTITDGNATGVK